MPTLSVTATIYQETLRRNLAAALNTQTHLTVDLKNEGFVGLGSYYSQDVGAADAYNQAQQVQAAVIKPAPLSDATAEATNWIYVRAEQYIAGLDDNSKAGLIVGAAVRPVSDENAIIAEFLKKSASSIPASCNSTGSTNNGQAILARVIDATGCDPSALSRMKNTGDYLSILGWIGMGLAATAKVSGSIPIIGESLKTFADIFLTLMETMTFFATMLSTYLPLLPYIAWLGAIISWLTVVIEGVVAAPLWAFAHLDTDGEGMGGRAERGYTFLMNVALRPVLMVVGFVASILLIDIVGKFFFMTYAATVANSSAGSFQGLVALIVYIAIFFTTSVMIVNTCVNLIHVIPDVVLTWITNSTASTGVASGMSGNFSVAATGATGAGQ